jgi:GT2 family glycosyltransferase
MSNNKRRLICQENTEGTGLRLAILWPGFGQRQTLIVCARIGDQKRHYITHALGPFPSIVPLPSGGDISRITLWSISTDSANRAWTIGRGMFCDFIWRVYRGLELIWAALFYQITWRRGFLRELPAKASKEHPTLEAISVVIPSRDRPDLIRAQWQAGLKDFVAKGGELVIVDHASVKAETAAALQELAQSGVKVVRAEGPFNFSRLVNLGVSASQRAHVLALNDDVQLTCKEDLLNLCAPLLDQSIGAVGAILLYENGLLQHCGVLVGGEGLATHFGRGCNPADKVNSGLVTGLRLATAVTGAAIAFRRNDFNKTGGFCERLVVELNDIDFCLRLKARGLKIVVNTEVRLVHPELTSRGDPLTGGFAKQIRRDRSRFFKSWWKILPHDACYPLAWGSASSHLKLRFPPAIGRFE